MQSYQDEFLAKLFQDIYLSHKSKQDHSIGEIKLREWFPQGLRARHH